MAVDTTSNAVSIVLAAVAGAALLLGGLALAGVFDNATGDAAPQVIERRVIDKAPAAEPDPKVEIDLPDTIEIGDRDNKDGKKNK